MLTDTDHSTVVRRGRGGECRRGSGGKNEDGRLDNVTPINSIKKESVLESLKFN